MEQVLNLIKSYDITRYRKLENYYRGLSPIISREVKDNKPNNRIVSSFAINAVDTVQGYFMGKPVAYSGEEFDAFQQILNNNDEQEVNAEHVKQIAIKGRSYELLYVNEQSELEFAQLDPENVLLEYDDSVKPKPFRATLFYPEYDSKGKVIAYEYHIYQPFKRLVYYAEERKKPILREEVDHPFSEIPIIEYTANSEHMGLFEKAIRAIDSYEKAVSDTANDLEYFTDAYLWLPGFGGYDPTNEDDKEKLRNMRNNRVFLPNDEEGNKPEFIVKQINDTATENHKNRLKDEIHRMLNIPDLTDESFAGTQSGVSLKYKLWGLENICSSFERRFKKSLQKRLRLIAEYLNIRGGNFNYQDIQITFSRNLPDNTIEAAELVEKLRGLVSDRTLLSWIDRVEDPEAEMEAPDAQSIILYKQNNLMSAKEAMMRLFDLTDKQAESWIAEINEESATVTNDAINMFNLE